MIERIDKGVAQGLGTDFRCHSEGPITNYRIADKPGLLTDLIVTNITDEAGFVQLFDATELPGDGATPLLSVPLPADKGAIEIGARVAVQSGLVLAISTTVDELTESTNEAMVFANFTRR